MNVHEKLKTKDLIAAIALLIISIIIYTDTFNMKTLTVSQVGPDFAPRVVSIGIFILSLILLFQTLKDWIMAAKNVSSAKASYIKDAKEMESNKGYENDNDVQDHVSATLIEDKASRWLRYKNVLITTVLIVLYILLMPIIGFLITTAVYLFIQFCLLGQRKYWNIPLFLILSILTSVIVYYVFRLGFEVMLPAGILG
ncbi:hypothetical protein GCM10011409_15650 [Lentibacillus populi]|uniref:DUF1468 domain-containing protein n=1 Tax=Lentibacillus populi TaxID=1827502 RepID=A0A9W5TWW2_9BACI|nr:tripartite tricarboxylate transporter TctB family protein [Lentibacillus populi]GGB38990.1 hypothetical protein GCM10011409_15650 [Lentibacillus populi]